jgi:plastocyanin
MKVRLQIGVWIFVALGCAANLSYAQHEEHLQHGTSHQGMQFDSKGMVMNSNHDELPQNCSEISEDVAFTVRAGTEYAVTDTGRVFGFSQYEFRVKPCARVAVTFVNEDQVRHQWMLHGLPRYLYAQGMFHLEANAGETVSGTFIVPADDATYLVHCDITQHMEKGMKAQFIVGAGSAELWSVPSITEDFNIEKRMPYGTYMFVGLIAIISAALFSHMLVGKD